MNVILFDLFGTLIEKESYNYANALQWLANRYFDGKFEELQNLSDIFKSGYVSLRKTSLAETSFLKQLHFFEESLDMKIDEDYYNVELEFIRIFRKEKPVNGAADFLKYLKNKGYRIYVVTNSLFSGRSLKAYIDDLKIGNYIEKVYSSADIGFRKPSLEIFSFVLDELGIINTGEVLFIGDSFEKDYEGARKSGLTPVLLGTYENKNTELCFNDISELKEKLCNVL